MSKYNAIQRNSDNINQAIYNREVIDNIKIDAYRHH